MRKHFLLSLATFLILLGLLTQSPVFGQGKTLQPDVSDVVTGKGWNLINRKASAISYEGKTALYLAENKGEGLAWLIKSSFSEGIIEVDLKGRNVMQASFVGIAFHVVDAQTYEAIYLRPFNFKSPDSVRRSHSVQYIAHPTYTWSKLREEHPGTYENYVSPVPDPEKWMHLKVVVKAGTVRAYLDRSTKPSLVVERLSQQPGGSVGLFLGDGSDGSFANLTITPDK